MIGSILGGIAGLLIPGGGGFLASTIGSAVGGLLSGQDPKDAIKNSLIFGGVNYMFPGVANALQQSSIGRSATSALGNMGIGTNKGLAALTNAAPTASTSAASGIASAASKGPSVRQIYNMANLGSGVGSLLSQDKQGSTEPHPDYTGEIDRSEFTKNLYANKYTGERYDTVEERNASERRYAEDIGLGYARGGYIEGPGTGRSDDIPAQIYQGGVPVQEARLSDGEFVMTEKAVENGGGAAAMYARMKQLENGGPA
jgi:hypothetical protein|tara:strand:- start:813 stop:1583 length:771 start_codon:yes stop_codon:yes gene_type:complete